MQVIKKPLSWFRPDPNQPRKTFDPERLRELNANLRIRQLVPVLARSDGVIIDGERRLRAAQLGGIETLDVIVTEERLTESQIAEMQLVLSVQREDLPPFELFCGMQRWLDVTPGATAQDLAEHMGKSPAMVSKTLSLKRGTSALLNAAEQGLVGPSVWNDIVKRPREEQDAALATYLNGGTRDGLERQRRAPRNVYAAAPRVSRVKCQLGSAVVTVAAQGDGLSLDDIIETLSALLKEARKANDQGVTAKTWERYLRDKAGV
jgi:ParB/RepB/Spo0J family partition protein